MHRQPGGRLLAPPAGAQRTLQRLEDDLDACASLGVTALRYPVLWEEVESPSGERDFTLADRAMRHLEKSPMTPIVGLLHHGSGPPSTSLDDPALPERLADFAGEVARRYPWVADWTPVNEPLTTARFSGLYGHWYPHARDDRAFVTMLLNEVKATILAMRAIREVNPDARLIQTEDFGRMRGTPAAARPGRVREPSTVADVRPALRTRRAAAPAVPVPDRHGRRRPGRAAVDRRQRLPARHPGAQPLPAQQSLAGSPPRSVPPRIPRRQRADALRGRGGVRHAVHLAALAALASRRDLAPLRDPDRRHRGAHLRSVRGPGGVVARGPRGRGGRDASRHPGRRRDGLEPSRIVRLGHPLHDARATR